MKKTIFIALLIFASVASSVEYKPRKVIFSGRAINATNNMIPLFVNNPGTGKYVLCKNVQEVMPYRDNFMSALGVVVGGEIQFSIATARALWDHGVNFIGHGCVLGNSDKDAQEKLWAIDAAAKEAKKNQPHCVQAYVGTRVWCDNQIKEKLGGVFDENYNVNSDIRKELIDYVADMVAKNYGINEKNNLMKGRQEEEGDILKSFEILMANNDIAWTSKKNKVVQVQPMQSAQAQVKPSFDCKKASNETEIAICQNDKLAKLDVGLYQNYKNVLNVFASPEFRKTAVTEVRLAQKVWLLQRNACLSNIKCIHDSYIERNEALCGFGMPSGVHPCIELLND